MIPPIRRNLLDCVPAERIRRWAQDCARSHDAFNAKVADLAAMFNALHATTEELFMTGPDVDIAALEEELERAQGKLAEQAAVIQCLDKDLNTVGRLVEETVGDLASNRGGTGSVGGGALDACAALDPMNELHVKSHLPAVEAVDREMAALHWHCAQCKHAMGACVHRQLQSISALQSQIHQTRNKQAGFKEWGKRQEQKFRELRIVWAIVFCGSPACTERASPRWPGARRSRRCTRRRRVSWRSEWRGTGSGRREGASVSPDRTRGTFPRRLSPASVSARRRRSAR